MEIFSSLLWHFLPLFKTESDRQQIVIWSWSWQIPYSLIIFKETSRRKSWLRICEIRMSMERSMLARLNILCTSLRSRWMASANHTTVRPCAFSSVRIIRPICISCVFVGIKRIVNLIVCAEVRQNLNCNKKAHDLSWAFLLSFAVCWNLPISTHKEKRKRFISIC